MTEPTAKREPLIIKILNELEVGVADLVEIVATLNDRLEPILSLPIDAEVKIPNEKLKSSCPLHDRLRADMKSVCKAVSELRSVRDRIEV